MISPHGQLRVYVSTRPVDFRKGIDGLALAVQEVMGLDPFCGAAFVFRAKRADRLKIVLWDRTGMVFGAVLEPVAHAPLTPQAPGERQVRVAAGAGRHHADVAGAVLSALRSCMLMPLLVRLTDSQVDAIDNMVSQVADRVDDDGRVLEEVGPVGLAIDEKPLSPDLHV